MAQKEEVNTTLIVKHLPTSLDEQDKVSLLKHFGAKNVRVMGAHGRMKHTAFATFSGEEAAKIALARLHQVDILGQKLTVEFSKSQYTNHHPDPTIQTKCKDDMDIDDEDNHSDSANEEENIFTQINCLSSKWQIDYPINPKLKYMYPPPSMSILTNIANALASVPKFYVQVLHLMNRMNLPAPFGAITATPPLAEDMAQPPPLPTQLPPELPPDPDEMARIDALAEESELSDEEESEIKPSMPIPKLPKKRKAKSLVGATPKLKFQKIIENMPTIKGPGIAQKPEDVFEHPQGIKTKKSLDIKISAVPSETTISSADCITNVDATPPQDAPKQNVSQMLQSMTQKYEKLEMVDKETVLGEILDIIEEHHEPDDSVSNDPLLHSIMESLQSLYAQADGNGIIKALCSILETSSNSSSGFGKIEPIAKEDTVQSSSDEELEEWGSGNFISSRRLRKGRISSAEMKNLNVFRKYAAGDPTARLYIKNLSTKTTDRDLHYIFGRYMNWDDENKKTMFDIRLMKEGRMKGQAFVTLAEESKAIEAVNEVNGFELNGKVMVVQFARSAKLKPEEEGKDKKS